MGPCYKISGPRHNITGPRCYTELKYAPKIKIRSSGVSGGRSYCFLSDNSCIKKILLHPMARYFLKVSHLQLFIHAICHCSEKGGNSKYR